MRARGPRQGAADHPVFQPHAAGLTISLACRPAALYLGGMEVQIFGTKKSADTRKALRFFSERRVRTHFVDLQQRAASPGELRRFARKFGVQALIDTNSRRFAELGLTRAHLSDERWIDRLADEPMLLRVPLVRWQQQLTVGADETAWREWTGR
jgi:arsenate reductase (glutaredoxin)